MGERLRMEQLRRRKVRGMEGKRSPIGNSDIASMLARRLRGHVPLRAASPQHGRRLRVPGFFVCGVMCRCGVKGWLARHAKRATSTPVGYEYQWVSGYRGTAQARDFFFDELL